MELTDSQLAFLAERKRGWPSNGGIGEQRNRKLA
jgi:hypothetical protein